MRAHAAIMAFFIICASDAGTAANLKIDKPENDKLVMTPLVDVEGTATPQGAMVTVTANGVTLSTVVADGRWSVKGLSLSIGANLIDVQSGDEKKSVLAVRGADNVGRLAPRKVRFLWN